MKITRYKDLEDYVKKTCGKDWLTDHRMSLGLKILRIGYKFAMQGYIEVNENG